MPKEENRPVIKAKITLRKFDGDDQSKEPVETIEVKDEGFDELVALLEARRKGQSNGTD